ncbi:MAG TPA: hypothetical protein VK745_29185 [Polyangiaceae bacterium]|jgi:hypothetical protein|nr:hypothetical protein [Polyangiaceae bacterium]
MNHPQPHASLALAFASVAVLAACGGRFDPAHFEGSSEPRRTAPEALRELATRTSQLEAIGGVHASCALHPGFHRLDGEALSDLDCSTERLDFALRESAASAGGDALIGVHCDSRRLGTTSRETHRLSCAAEVARFSGKLPSERPLAVPESLQVEGPAPSAAEVQRIDEPDASLSFRISLKFEPTVPKFEGRPRVSAEVNELPLLPLADRPLGDLVASCEDGCDERALRRGVLIAAGRLGVPDVVSVRCFSSTASNSCVGTLAAPERDE